MNTFMAWEGSRAARQAPQLFSQLEFRYAWVQGGRDPIYQTVPFYLGLDKGKSYGIFLT